ncbi:hypothetical protein Bca4012_083049 [Brassica carinata]
MRDFLGFSLDPGWIKTSLFVFSVKLKLSRGSLVKAYEGEGFQLGSSVRVRIGVIWWIIWDLFQDHYKDLFWFEAGRAADFMIGTEDVRSGGRNFGIGVPKEQHGRFAINPRGIQNLRHGEEGHNLSNPQKLMMDAFKGANQHPKATQVSQRTMVEDGNNSKARKSLQFDETVNAEVAGEVIEEVSVNMRQEIPTPLDGNLLIGDEVMKDLDLMEQDQSALDDANLMIEGVLLSDSELLDEEWEEGEVPEFMEEMEEMPLEVGSEKVVEAQNISEDLNEKEDHGAKASKKKGLKTGVFGGASKKRLVQNLLSPRKNKMAKAPVKNGDKGNGEGKKVLSKPKDGNA